MRGLGDSIDERSIAYKTTTLALSNAEREAQRRAALTPEQRAIEEAARAQLAQTIVEIGQNARQLNGTNPVTLPLNATQEKFRQLSVAGDFQALSLMVPLSVHRWSPVTPIGKFRFNIVNGKKVYVPFTEADLYAIYFGPWYAQLIEPRYEGIEAVCDQAGLVKKAIADQKNNAKTFPTSDWRHVLPIYPGQYLCKVQRESTWVKIRKPVAIAVAIVGAVYLGPIIAEKMAAMAAESGAASGASSATTFTKIKEGVNTVLGYVNKARTVDAIVHGELPPPPISIVGDSFVNWATIVAKEQIVKEAKEQAAELGMEYIQRKMTEAEEKKLRAEILAMQAELARLIPENTPKSPDPAVPLAVQKVAADVAIQNKQVHDLSANALAIAVPVAALLFMGS